jgi:nitroreductase
MDLLELMRDRRSSRGPFDERKPVAMEDIRKVLEAARWAPTAHNMQNFEIVVVNDTEVLGAIASIDSPLSETFLQENYPHLSFSEEELMKKKTGLLGTMFPPEWTDPDIISGKKPMSKERLTAARPFIVGPLLFIVLYDPSKRAPASEGDFLGIMSLGCVMENMWLMAQSLGLAFQVMSSLSAEGMTEGLRTLLRIPALLKIAFSARVGHPLSTHRRYLRVRRDIVDFVSLNRYGDNIGE